MWACINLVEKVERYVRFEIDGLECRFYPMGITLQRQNRAMICIAWKEFMEWMKDTNTKLPEVTQVTRKILESGSGPTLVMGMEINAIPLRDDTQSYRVPNEVKKAHIRCMLRCPEGSGDTVLLYVDQEGIYAKGKSLSWKELSSRL